MGRSKRPRKKRPEVKKKPKLPRHPDSMTKNEIMILELMRRVNRRGNPRDFVILSGLRMIDYYGTYDIKGPSKEGKAPTGVRGVMLVHKKNLHKIFGDEVAGKFWNRKLRIRVPVPRDREEGNARALGEESAGLVLSEVAQRER